MSEQSIRELTRLLGAEDRDVGFLDYLPADEVDKLAAKTRETLGERSRALDEAIEHNTRRLPAPLSALAHRILTRG